MRLDKRWQVLIIVCIGIFMSTLDSSILNIANPTIAQDLSISMTRVQWVVTSYMLVITASLLFFGRWGDKIGSEKVYTWGFLVFGIGSLFCSISDSLWFLIIARIVQAFGASMMMATGIGIVSNTFPASERGKAMGITGSIVGIGNMTGPSLGGLLIAKFNWPAIFLINVPVAVIGFLLGIKLFTEQPRNFTIKGFDNIGMVLFALSVTTLLLSLTTGKGIDVYIFAIFMILILVFWFYEENTTYPLLDFSLFKNKIFLQGNLMGMTAYITQMMVYFLLPFYMEEILTITPAKAGLIMTIPPVTLAIVAPLAGTLSDKLGSTHLVQASFFMLSSAYFILSLLGSAHDIIKIICGLLVMGAGLGMFGSPNSNAIFGSIPPEKAGYTGGFAATVRNLCFSLGIALSVSIFTCLFNLAKSNLPHADAYARSIDSVYKIAALIAFFTLIVSLVSKPTLTEKSAKDIP